MAVRGRYLMGIVGLAVACLLAAGLLVIASNRAKPSGGATATGLHWQSANLPVPATLSPLLASAAGRLYMVALTGRNGEARAIVVWSSPDGLTWDRMASPGMEADYVPRAVAGDGTGGLVVVGELTSSEQTVPEIWHASAGGPFGKAQLDSGGPGSGEIVAVAAGQNRLVALGDHSFVTASPSKNVPEVRGLDAWSSPDGASWAHADLPDSDGYQAIALTAWGDGFAAVGYPMAGRETSTVWTSADGSTWLKRADVAAFGVSAIVALGNRLVILGARTDTQLGMTPAAWSSTDATTWVESAVPVNGAGVSFDAAAVVGGSVVAIGTSHVGTAAPLVEGSVPAYTMPPIGSPSVWISSDGSTWLAAGAAPQFQPYVTSIAAFGDSAVIATVTATGVAISVADLTGAGTAARSGWLRGG
jgi:hypothetical protein